jgi:centromere/kinetochore protein ZW10
MEVDTILANGAQGFAYTGDQDRYDECEMAVNEALKHIKRLAQRLKVYLIYFLILLSHVSLNFIL